jgi:membrane associated rhomboid family serine protease
MTMTMNRHIDPAGTPHSSHQPAINLAPVVTGAILVLVAIHLGRTYLLSDDQNVVVIALFGFVPSRGWGDVLTAIELITHSFLHGGAAHLIVNSIWLAVFGSPLAVRIGTVRFLLFWAVTAAAGALAIVILDPEFPGVLIGASGAISGMAGAATRYGFRIDRSRVPAAYSGSVLPVATVIQMRQVYTFILVWAVTNVLAGAGLLTGGGQAIAWQAHLGGFAAGFLLIGLFVPNSSPESR